MIIETLSMIGRNLLWQSALLAAIVFCVLYMLPRSQITARYRVALSGLFGAVLLLILPFLPVTSFGFNLVPETLLPVNSPLFTTLPHAVPPGMPGTQGVVTINTHPEFSLGLILVRIWLAGCLVALSRLGLAAWQGGKLVRSSTPVRLYDTAALSQNVTITRSSAIQAPLVVGLLRPTIVVPLSFQLDLDNPETRVILEHEIAHITRNDLWVNFVQRLILAVLWWCLPLYWINRQIGAERENLCDAIATSQIQQTFPSAGNPARLLAGALVRFAEQKSNIQTPALAIGIHPQAKLLARRVQRLCDSNPVPRLSKKLLLSSSLAVPAALFMLSVVTPRALASSPQENTPLAVKPVISAPDITVEAAPSPTQTIVPVQAIIIVQGRLTSKYGLVRKQFGGKMHTGVDIANKSGTPIYAPADARIVDATDTYKNSTNWGKVVVIETAGGVQTVFAHLKSYTVTTGQTITAGTQIGQVGNTGVSTGPHVHLETLIDGRHVDPLTVWTGLPN